MSIYIGNDLEDRLEALETKNTILREYNEYRQIVDEMDHMSDLHLDSSFYKRSMKLDKYVKIEEWFDSSLGQSTVIQRLDLKKPHYPNKRKIKENTLISKMDLISFVALTSIIRRQLFASFWNRMNSGGDHQPSTRDMTTLALEIR